MSTVNYGESFAELYDTFYADKPYQQETEFINSLIRGRLGHGPLRLLELACGTGNHSFHFERLGYRVFASDISTHMIQVAKRKAQRLESSVDFQVGDMCDMGAGDAPYDVIVCLFDSVGYLLENERVVRCLNNIYNNLKHGGLCILEYWHAGAMLSARSAIRYRTFKAPNCEILRVSETTCSLSEQNCTVDFNIVVTKTDGTWSSFRESHKNRYFLKKEMDLFFQVVHLRPQACYGGYTESLKISEDSWHLVHLAER